MHGRTGYGLAESCIWYRKPLQHLVHAPTHTNMVMGGKKEGKLVHFPQMEISFFLGSCACTKFWDINKCPTIQHKTQHQPESRKGWGGERWAPTSIQDWRAWPWLIFPKSPLGKVLEPQLHLESQIWLNAGWGHSHIDWSTWNWTLGAQD